MDFLLFKTIIELMKTKKHLKGLTEIISIKASMNKGLSNILRNHFVSILPVVKPKINLVRINLINPYWFYGFTDA